MFCSRYQSLWFLWDRVTDVWFHLTDAIVLWGNKSEKPRRKRCGRTSAERWYDHMWSCGGGREVWRITWDPPQKTLFQALQTETELKHFVDVFVDVLSTVLKLFDLWPHLSWPSVDPLFSLFSPDSFRFCFKFLQRWLFQSKRRQTLKNSTGRKIWNLNLCLSWRRTKTRRVCLLSPPFVSTP